MPTVIQSKNEYQCKHCGLRYTSLIEARDCERDHDIVYVPIQRADLKRLLIYLLTGNSEILTKSFLDTINKYSGLKSE